MKPNEVVIHPHRRTLVKTRLDEIVRTVRQHGMTGQSLGAAVAYRASVGWVLLGGEHRWAALSAPGSGTEVIILRSWDDLVAWMAVDASDPRRLGWDPIAAVSFYEKTIAALKPGRNDKPVEDVAEFTGVHRQVLETVRWANSVIADGDIDLRLRQFLQGQLDRIEQGGDGGHSLRERYKKFMAKLENEGRAPASAAVQRKALESVGTLSGIVGALAELGPINPEIPMSERRQLAEQLGRLGAQLAKIKKNLRGETE
jgi:hypothetical protein